MPVLGVASKLRQPAVGSKPVHTALPIPSLGPAGSQQYPAKALEYPGAGSAMLSCQLALKSTCGFGERRALQEKTQEMEDSKVGCKLFCGFQCLENVHLFREKTISVRALLHAQLEGNWVNRLWLSAETALRNGFAECCCLSACSACS